jgi:hypothetical protein
LFKSGAATCRWPRRSVNQRLSCDCPCRTHAALTFSMLGEENAVPDTSGRIAYDPLNQVVRLTKLKPPAACESELREVTGRLKPASRTWRIYASPTHLSINIYTSRQRTCGQCRRHCKGVCGHSQRCRSLMRMTQYPWLPRAHAGTDIDSGFCSEKSLMHCLLRLKRPIAFTPISLPPVFPP